MTEISLTDIRIYVFSFNRGIFLENCLRSIENCAPSCEVVVIDDQSDDQKTKDVLDDFSDKFQILIAGEQGEVEHKTGGLNNNMSFAISAARGKNIRYELFLPDDMQLVRPLLDDDIANAEIFFASNNNSAELHTCFMKRLYANKEECFTGIDDSGKAYLRSSDYQGNSGFSDVGLFDVVRFFELFTSLKLTQGEYFNNQYAQKNNIQMGITIYPFMMWLPYPISYRGKKRSVPLRVLELFGGCGYYPYSVMSSSKVNSLISRDIEKRPYAEEWLSAQGLKHARLWSFTGGVPNLMARGGARAWLGGLLYKLKNKFLPVRGSDE
jgi:glycosyltransferase involved in cell wall biosynthesis